MAAPGNSEHERAQEILEHVYERASADLSAPIIVAPDVQANIELVCRHQVGADVRVLMSCLLGKLLDSRRDIRKPYTKLGTGAFGGRTYDERYISAFINKHSLPCNRTTGFLTPAFRAKNIVLARDVNLEGESSDLDRAVLDILNDVHEGKASPDDVFAQIVRCLLAVKASDDAELRLSLERLRELGDHTALSAEAIVGIVRRHLEAAYSSRLPVLVVSAAYEVAADHLGERALPLQLHNAADKQTGALGDVEITLVGDDRVIRTYEMKDKRIITDDINQALAKIREYWRRSGRRIESYVFITTERIDPEILEYAASLYESTGGIEFAVLDCVGFLRHFLHLFHRLRMRFLDAYQAQVLAGEASGVRHELKVLLLALRRAAESSSTPDHPPSGQL